MNLSGYHLINKKLGETPLEAVKRFKRKFPHFKNETVSYAGRLDPLADGQLLLLIGRENKKRHQYEKLDKEYLFEILFGLSSQSDDLLGFPQERKEKYRLSSALIRKALEKIKQQTIQTPPVFASVRVQGKPLYWWARNNKLDEISIPKRKILIHSIELIGTDWIDKEELSRTIKKRVGLVKGNFRQDQISKSWEKILKEMKRKNFVLARVKARVGSGTYIRSIARDTGIALKIPALAISITRTKIFLNDPQN